ncbi:hypothetical protein LLH23_13005 [bacterium]|nr:hypothetical protein [bacterium]
MQRTLGVTILIALLAAGAATAADLTAGGVRLTLSDDLSVTGLAVGGRALPITPAPFVTLWATDAQQTATAAVTGGSLATGLQVSFAAARASAQLQAAPRGEALHFRCAVKGQDGPDRGLILRFSLPVDATGWRWYDDMQTSSVIGPGKTYENVDALRAYADMPEWKDKPALRMGYANRNFCTVIAEAPGATGAMNRAATGLVLAVPVDKPCMFRTAYDGAAKRLDLVYDFALSGLTRKPYEVEFEFDLYACDGAWGMRSALQKYYALYPEQFKVYVPRQGQWMAFSRLSEIDNANEFGFGLQEGAPEPQYDDKIGVLDCTYYTHAGMGANLPKPYDPEKDPLPSYDEQVKAVNEAFRRNMGEEGIYDLVGTRKPDGKLAVEKWVVYAHLIAQFNLDPELPWGQWLVERTIKTTESVKQGKGGDLDGFYYDGLTHGLNYNRDHFKTTDAPLLWDPAHQQAFLNNFYSAIEFARATAELLRPRGQITMMNGGLSESFYVVPWLDVLGAETGLIIPRSGFNSVRSILYHKPFMTLLKGNYEQRIGYAEMELFMKRCLAYGVYPGFFDWPPSGLGPGGQYWNHSRYYERDRDLFRKYQPLCQALATAGWEPVTCARSSDPNVYVERFGPGSSGVVWLTLLNEQKQALPTTLTVDAKALGLNPANLRATEITSGQTLTAPAQGGSVALALTVPAEGVAVVQLGSPAAVAAWHLGQAAATVESGAVQRQVDAAKPPLLVHWKPGGQGYDREQVGDKTNVVFHADGKSSMSMTQWVMLFQSAPTPLKLRLKLSATNFTDGGDARVRCRLAWVTPSYTHYEMKDFNLPGGTYDGREVEFEINAEQALRSVEVTPTLGAKASGDLKIASLSVTDSSGHEDVVDPEFARWWEPFPAALREPVEAQMTALKQGLGGLQGRATDLAKPAFRQELGRVFAGCQQVEQKLAQAKAENGGRRVLRDLDTVKTHLSYVALASYNMTTPAIVGPSAAAPGDTVSLQFAAPKAGAGWPPMRAELQSDLKVIPKSGGGAVTIPADAKPGDNVLVNGLLHLGRPGQEATLRSSHTIRVVTPLEMTLQSEGFEATTGAARLRVHVRNNHLQAVTAQLAVVAPSGWGTGGAKTVRLPAGQETSTDVVLAPAGKPAAGALEISARATAGPDAAQARLVMLYMPPEANLIPNPGFEDGLKPWAAAATESLSLDTQVFRSGKQSLCFSNPTRRDTQASVGVTLNQKQPTPILVQASAKGENVEGQPGKGFSLYVDIYYMDGTPWYGNTRDFPTGTTDWQLGELYLEPAKPIKVVNVYLLLRGKSGKAWFDDIAVMEDPGRKGNLARGAQVAVDSGFPGYDASPVNDGVIIGEGLHWTKEAWASADDGQEHFIELQFPQPVTVSRATIYWSLDAGLPRTSQEVSWQVFEGGAWRTLKTTRPLQPAPQTEIKLEAPATGDRFRLLQPAGKGSKERTGLMWVREVEVFGP